MVKEFRYAPHSFPLVGCFLFSFLAFSTMAWGQKDTGSIVETVTDSSGAVVTKARVVVADLDRGTNFATLPMIPVST
jgi:hypothetical protein